MRAIICENLKELNEVLVKEKVEEIKYSAHIVGKESDAGVVKWKIVDRFLVIIN